MNTIVKIILPAVLVSLAWVTVAKERPASFTVGSSRECVEAAQGAPDRIDKYPALGYDIWRYGDSQVRISVTTGRVLEWIDISRNLKAVDPDPVPAPVVNPTRQSGQSVDVHFEASFDASVNQTSDSAQSSNQSPGFVGLSGNCGDGIGSAPRRSGLRKNAGRGTDGFHIPGVPGILNGPGGGSLGITINDNNPVPAANDRRARAEGGEASKDFFDVGSSKDDVLRLQGNPDRIDHYPALGYDIWRYGASHVRISVKTGEVMECIDLGRNLKTHQ